MVFVDSSVWIDYFNGTDNQASNKLDAILGNQEVIIGDLILTEVLQGFRLDNDYKLAKSALLSCDIRELLGVDMALKSTDNFRLLRKKGITIRKTADVIIASYCISNKLPLLFSDKDFIPFVEKLNLKSAL
jgi:hypothetical protein